MALQFRGPLQAQPSTVGVSVEGQTPMVTHHARLVQLAPVRGEGSPGFELTAWCGVRELSSQLDLGTGIETITCLGCMQAVAAFQQAQGAL